MKVSKDFLNDYVNIKDIDFKTIAEKMVFLGNEYESIKKISEANNLVVGKVLERKDHPSSDKLNVCTVDIGDSNTYQIVCGAPNVDKGQKVIVAKVGSTLPGDITISKTVIRGMESNGMICSLAELGLEKKFLTEIDYEGIHVLGDDAVLGTDAVSYLGFDDEVIDFELTPDRSDLLSMIGMAYEVGSLYDLEVKYPEYTTITTGEDVNVNHKLEITTDNCMLFLLRKVNNVKITTSPDYIRNRLIASGIRPINNVVDISNYVMLETGQPLHFYDADQLGNNVLVRMAKDGEQITTIDKKVRTLTSEDIVITNGNTPVSLAGVMGGFDTEVSETTKNIIIESAVFNPVSILKTSKNHLRSEGSSRFEKGINKEMTTLAINRACYLLDKYASGEVAPGVLSSGEVTILIKTITISLSKIKNILGINLKTDDVINVFKKLKLEYTLNKENFTINIPPRRLDLNIEEDIIEEVGRVIGYDKVQGILPRVIMKSGTLSDKNMLTKKTSARLKELGLNEVITYSLISEKKSSMFILEEKELVRLMDPQSINKSIMRNSLITSLLDVYDYNNDRNDLSTNIFEVGSRYYYENKKYVEVNTLSALISGTYIENKWQNNKMLADFYLAKGIVENLLDYYGIKGRYSFSEYSHSDMHPHRCAKIIVGLETIGFLGQVHPSIASSDVYVFELNLDIILNLRVRGIKYKETTKYPSINKDVAFIVDKKQKSKQIEEIIYEAGKPLIKSIDVFDLYMGPGLDDNKKSIAYSLVFSDPKRTLTDEEVTTLFNNIIKEVTTKTSASLRDK